MAQDQGKWCGVIMSGKVTVRQTSAGCGRRERVRLGVLLRVMGLSYTMKKITTEK